MPQTKFDVLVERLTGKMTMSQVPVPGFLVSLSGTDSVIVMLMLYEAAKLMGIPHRVYGIHYIPPTRRKPGWFERELMPWLAEACPEARLEVQTPLGCYQDPQRWADLRLRALNIVDMEDGRASVTPLEMGQNYWVAGTINATEYALGNYSMDAANTSLQPLRKVWKSDVMAMCRARGVPEIALENAQLPDCLCGRDELAAAHIELIDDILTLRLKVADHPPELLEQLIGYVRDRKLDNGFKERTPYLL